MMGDQANKTDLNRTSCRSRVWNITPTFRTQYSLPRDAMRKRGLCYRPVSVCPSSVRHVRVLRQNG